MRGPRRGRHRFGKLPRATSLHSGTQPAGGVGSDSQLQIVLWDTRHGGAFKDFAGGYGVGQFHGRGFRGKVIEQFYRRDFRSPPLAYGYLAADLAERGHSVDYSLEATPPADVYIFNPALMTLPYELQVMQRIKTDAPRTKLLVVGTVASTMPDAFAGVDCVVLKGEPEQLIPKFDEVLNADTQRVDIGTVQATFEVG